MKTKTEDSLRSKSIYPQGTFICPICGKEFKANDDTRYFIAGGYTCSWKCFLTEAKEYSEKKNSKKTERNKRLNV